MKKNLDGIRNLKFLKPTSGTQNKIRQIVKVDSVIKGQPRIMSIRQRPARSAAQVRIPYIGVKNMSWGRTAFLRVFAEKKVPVLAAVLALFLAFGGGMWFVLNTTTSSADNSQPQVLGAYTSQPSSPIVMQGATVPAANTVSNDVLFNTPIEYLKQYLQDVSAPDVIAKRTSQIKDYLEQKKSPLTSAAATIAAQPHWDIIMAVAFAESSWGRNCTDNNCSNIGVKPGAPSWRQYKSYDAWVIDFNRLLDKKYKDWNSPQMCGVYVKPCNSNWLLATQQVLDQLQADHIE